MPIIVCPNCKAILRQSDNTFRCENAHAFDLSKDGYINLLLANKKKKLNPGDSKMMMDARETFLSQGHYDFLLIKIESTIDSLHLAPLPETGAKFLLDMGCGTGYYTRNLFKHGNFEKIGIDVSKQGISKASKKDKESTYLVGSIFDLPIKDDSVDLILNIFSPISLEEVERVLKPGGIIVKVIPGSDHMREIADIVYETFIPHESSIETDLEANETVQILDTQIVDKIIPLAGLDLRNAVSMTPYVYKFEMSALEQLKALSVTISFKIIIAKYG